MDVLAGFDRWELFGFAGELSRLDVDPTLVVGSLDAKDEGVVGAGSQVWVVGKEAVVFVAGKDSGVVETASEVMGGADGWAGMADAGGGVHCPIKQVKTVLIRHSTSADRHLISAVLISKYLSMDRVITT